MRNNLSLILFAVFWIVTFLMNRFISERSEIRMNFVLVFYLTNMVLVLYSVVKIFILLKNKDYSQLSFPLIVILTNFCFFLYVLYKCL